jgi:hypothetical protein
MELKDAVKIRVEKFDDRYKIIATDALLKVEESEFLPELFESMNDERKNYWINKELSKISRRIVSMHKKHKQFAQRNVTK